MSKRKSKKSTKPDAATADVAKPKRAVSAAQVAGLEAAQLEAAPEAETKLPELPSQETETILPPISPPELESQPALPPDAAELKPDVAAGPAEKVVAEAGVSAACTATGASKMAHPSPAMDGPRRAIAGMDSTGRGGMLSRTIMEHDAAVDLLKIGETAEAERVFHDVLMRAAAADRQGRIDWQPLIHYAETALTQRHADAASKYFGRIVRRADAEAKPYWQGRGLFGLARAQIALGQLAQARASVARFAKIARAFPPLKKTDDLVPDTSILAGLMALASGHPGAAQTSFLLALHGNGYFEGKLRTRLRPVVLLVGQTALDLGQPAIALEYARAVAASAAIDSLAETRSAWVGQARLLEARALFATGDTVAARRAASAAARALTVGADAGHPLTLEAHALLRSLSPP